ncbi:hypothetical protein ACO2Q3_13550 [Caulobacter sp. KR2-114]|uniref:hypothetical protein n=1 Tax=Caulobacter sp. KR2-114 TaxID=3400912 RepID=UPI003C04FFFE
MKSAAKRADRRALSWSFTWATKLLAVVLLVGCASAANAAMFLGTGLSDVKPEDRTKIEHPQPVQLIYVFKTKGAPNAQATKITKQQAFDAVKASGLFSEVSEGPAANGAILSISIDNVVDPEELRKAEGKGVVTGATFFIAGSTVTDHYLSTVDYVPGPTSPKITRTAQQVLLTQLGMINSAPQNAVKMANAKAAIAALVTELVDNPLNEAAKDPGFLASDAPGAAATPAQPAATPASQAAAAAPPAPAGSAPAPAAAQPAAPAPAQ